MPVENADINEMFAYNVENTSSVHMNKTKLLSQSLTFGSNENMINSFGNQLIKQGSYPTNILPQTPLHYSKTCYNLAQLMYVEQPAVHYTNPSPVTNEKNQRRQYYHHRHHVHEDNMGLKSKTRFSVTGPPSNCTVVRNTKLSFTPPSSPTVVGSGMTTFPCSTGNYASSSSSGCYSKTSYSSCSSTNSVSPRKRRADDDTPRSTCRSSTSSGVESCCSCDKCGVADLSLNSSCDNQIVQSGKRSKNETEDDDVVFVSETPAVNGWSPFSLPASKIVPSSKSTKKTRKNHKKNVVSNSKASPFAVPFSVPFNPTRPASNSSGYYLRSTAKDQCQNKTVSQPIAINHTVQERQSPSTRSVEKSIQNLAINISAENTTDANYQTRSKANKTAKEPTVIPPTPCEDQITNDSKPEAVDVNSVQSIRIKDARSSANFRKTYDIHGVIGVGGGGTVYAGTRKSDNLQVAVKEVPKNKVKRWGKLNDRVVPIEFDLLYRASSTGHKGIIQMLDWYERRKSYILVMERPQPVIDLFDYLNQNGALTEATARKIFLQIADSVLHCHSNGVVHRDIKDENVLLNLHTKEAKLIDFGCGTVLKNTPFTEFAGTPEFYPPEWFTHKKYNGTRVDEWSLGVLLYTMLEAEVPFSTEKKIVACELGYKHPERISESCKHLLACMLQKDESKRPTLAQSLQHPWFRNSLRGSKSLNAGVMSTNELFNNDTHTTVQQPTGHIITTMDTPSSPEHQTEAFFQAQYAS